MNVDHVLIYEICTKRPLSGELRLFLKNNCKSPQNSSKTIVVRSTAGVCIKKQPELFCTTLFWSAYMVIKTHTKIMFDVLLLDQ